MISDAREVFRDLHESGTFVLPNPFDAGSARLLQSLGAKALATTSSGFAATLGRSDQNVTAEELVAHVRALTAAVSVPVAVDAERGYADSPAGVVGMRTGSERRMGSVEISACARDENVAEPDGAFHLALASSRPPLAANAAWRCTGRAQRRTIGSASASVLGRRSGKRSSGLDATTIRSASAAPVGPRRRHAHRHFISEAP